MAMGFIWATKPYLSVTAQEPLLLSLELTDTCVRSVNSGSGCSPSGVPQPCGVMVKHTHHWVHWQGFESLQGLLFLWQWAWKNALQHQHLKIHTAEAHTVPVNGLTPPSLWLSLSSQAAFLITLMWGGRSTNISVRKKEQEGYMAPG